MLQGFWLKARTNDKLYPFNFDFMDEVYDGTQNCTMAYLHGYCAYFAYAYALKNKNGRIRTIYDYNNQLIHAYYVIADSEEGKEYYIDIRGITDDEEQFLDEFEVTEQSIDDGYFYFYEYSPNSKKDLRRFYNCYIRGFSGKEIMRDAKTFLNTYSEYYKII